MGKHVQRTYEEKVKIVEETLNGKTYSQITKKYGIRPGTISNWKKKYLNGTLSVDNRGKSKFNCEDIEILKKSYALLMEIRSQQHK